MNISIDGKVYTLPNSLADITITERIDYDNLHGKKLKEQLKKIIDIKDKTVQDLEYIVYNMDMACRTVSFFGKIDLSIVQQTSIEDVFAVFHTLLKVMSEDTDFSDKEKMIAHEFEWLGDTWVIQPTEVKQDSKMNFGEFVDAKQVVQNLYELGEEKWESLLMLCCIFLRKKGEQYDKSFTDENSERYKLMRELPLDKALNLGFFLTASTTTYLNSFPYFGLQGPSLVESQ